MQRNEDYMEEAGKTEMEPLNNTGNGEKAVHKEEKQMKSGDKDMSSIIVDEFDVNIPVIQRKKPVADVQKVKKVQETVFPVEKTVEENRPVRKEKPEKAEKHEKPERKEKKEIKKNNEFTIKLSGDVKKRIPSGFNLDEIGMIDLQEAEKIANEDMLFLTESDLIEELENIDLRSFKETEEAEGQTEREYQEVAVTVLEDDSDDETPEVNEEEEEEFAGEMEEEAPDTDRQAEDNESAEVEEEYDIFDEPLIIPLDDKSEQPEHEENGVMEITEEDEDSVVVEEMVLDQLDELVIEDDEQDWEAALNSEEEIFSSETAGDKDETETWRPVEEAVTLSPGVEAIVDEGPENEPDTEIYTSMMHEILPDEIRKIESISKNVSFIDDDLVEKESRDKKSVFDENRLGSITLDLVETSERDAVFLEEATPESDYNRVALSFLSFSKEYEDKQVEIEPDEYRFRDDDLDFIDNSVFEDDYGQYIREIDDLYEIKKRKEITNAVEILGLNYSEINFIEDRLYHDDYEDVNLDEIFNLIRFDSTGFDQSEGGDRYCNYILPEAESLLGDEKQSIEEDISARGALIFEENVREIEKKLGRQVSVEKSEPVEISETVYDITDKIVIIEDELDVDRFVREFPDEKQVDLKKLMKYLDGLFEKLPEDVVRNFADSEYFDIYVNILNDMGV